MKNNLIGENTSKEILKNPYLITNMNDFLSFYINKDGQFNGKYNGQRERLEKLRNTLGKDPIEYLYLKYYKEKLDIRSIRDKLKEIGHIFPHETLNNMFKKTFKWVLRGNHEETPGKKEKDINKSSLNGNGGLSKLNRNRAEETRKKVDEILEKSLGNNFNINIYNRQKAKIDKLSYIFYSFGIIKSDSRKIFRNFLIELKENFGENRISNIIIKIVERLDLNIIIKINSKETGDWINNSRKKIK